MYIIMVVLYMQCSCQVQLFQ